MSRTLLILALALALGGLTAGKSEPARRPVQHVVEIRGFEYHPERLAVSRGDTVIWINRDIAPHNATAENGLWGSPNLDTDESWELAVETEGLQSYLCTLHPLMVGQLDAR